MKKGWSFGALIVLGILYIGPQLLALDYISDLNNLGSGQQITISSKDLLLNAVINDPQFRDQMAKVTRFIMIVIILALFDLIMKGFAMWRASKNNSRIWYWVLLVINTAGILPICYLIFSKKLKKEEKK